MQIEDLADINIVDVMGEIIFRNGTTMNSKLATDKFGKQHGFKDIIENEKIVKLFNDELWLIDCEVTYSREHLDFHNISLKSYINLTTLFKSHNKIK